MDEDYQSVNRYRRFLESKRIAAKPAGFRIERSDLNPRMFEFQRDITSWAIQKGKCLLAEACGLGKTIQELEWSRLVHEKTNKPILNIAPLAVSQQTKREGDKFGIEVNICREQPDVSIGINITNYEMLKHFDPREFGGLVVDECGILKGSGPLRKAIQDFGFHIPYRLAASATPAPNDFMEFGNQSEFLGIMSKSEMLSTFFVHDGEDTSKWRLKGHAESAFYKWLASFTVMINKPSDLGYPDGDFKLLPIEYHQHTVKAEWTSDYLFPVEAKTMQDRQSARRDSLDARVALCAELINNSSERWIAWCNLNSESEALANAIHGAVEVTGSQPDEVKAKALLDFAESRIDKMVTKGKLAGWGMNYQDASHMALVGLSDSWELLHQIVRRMWRYGQKRPVHVHVITGELEGAVVRNIERKEKQAAQMAESMLGHMREINTAEIHGTVRETEEYRAEKEMVMPVWL